MNNWDKAPVGYCCFYRSGIGSGFKGQCNVSIPLRQVLALHFNVKDINRSKHQYSRFPSVARIIGAMQLILLTRLVSRASSSRQLNIVVDMVHSLIELPKIHFKDTLILVGHDSYALRSWRDLKHTGPILHKIRRITALLAWLYAEWLSRQVFSHQFFVSPIDRQFAGSANRSSFVPIPLSSLVASASAQLLSRRRNSKRRILIPVSVINASQNRYDLDIIRLAYDKLSDWGDIVIWGAASKYMKKELSYLPKLDYVEWAEDYCEFLAAFDLLIYPRVVGSGFHTKIAEAAALGVPCVCVDWVALPLIEAGYQGIMQYNTTQDLSILLCEIGGSVGVTRSYTAGISSTASRQKIAFNPIIERCFKTMGDQVL